MNNNAQLEAIQRIMGKPTKKNHGTKQKVSKKVHRHVWTVAEENLAIDLYMSGANDEAVIEAVNKTELKLTSMKMKLMNIKYLDTGEGLSNVSELTKTLFEKRLTQV